MNISLRWLNKYLTPTPGTPALTADQAEAILMAQGFPSESRTTTATCEGDDITIDLEVTSNRGDCLCHLGAAREVAASPAGGFRLNPPSYEVPTHSNEECSKVLGLQNKVPDLCPLFIARVIKGVRVQPSPAWLRALLEGAGQRPINNIVDITNFIALELGNPCHVFDLKKLVGPEIVVRFAKDGEKLTTLDGKLRALKSDELVVADAERAQGLAGVMGGGESEVTEQTADVVLEMATWDPVAVRRAARRHQLRTTASHRYERFVDARTLELAADRAVALICEVAGGMVCKGELRAGRGLASPTTIRFRPARCTAILGYELPTETMVRHLKAVEVEVGPLGRGGDELLCTAPAHRHDLTREIDLIEEVARIQGLEAVPVHAKVGVTVAPPQREYLAQREVANVLTALGFFETVSFSFTTPARAKALVASGLETIEIDDDRRGGEPALRPSVLAGLLSCRRQNQHGGVRQDGGVRLFEVASTFAQAKDGPTRRTVETTNIGLLVDVPGRGKPEDVQEGVRIMRGAVESLVRATHGADADLRFVPGAPHCPALDPGAYATIELGGGPLGYLGQIDRKFQEGFDITGPVIGCEVSMTLLSRAYPPKSAVVLPPAFPGIERDLSLVVAEATRWETIASLVRKHQAPPMEGLSFVTTYRDKKLGEGKKSVTLRLMFRDAARTLRHEEVDAPVSDLLGKMKQELAFELRA